MSKRKPVAFITGITGQDGAHLADSLLGKGYTVYGGFRRGVNKIWRTDYLGITDQIDLVECQLNEPQFLIELLQEIKPDEIYNLAAESFVADSYKHPSVTLTTNTSGSLNILDAIRLVSPDSRVLFASSSEIFGCNPGCGLLNEDSRHQPINPYAISKLAADYFVKMYREKYGLFACSAILFNHEGPLRGGQYVSRKITYNIARLKLKGGEPFELGNLDAARDWGAAIDYVEAMRLMLSLDSPEDFVVATGQLSKVRDLLELSALAVGFDPVFEGSGETEICVDKSSGKEICKVSKRYFRPHDTSPLVGDASKIESKTGWKRTKKIEQVIEEMVVADLDRREKGIVNV